MVGLPQHGHGVFWCSGVIVLLYTSLDIHMKNFAIVPISGLVCNRLAKLYMYNFTLSNLKRLRFLSTFRLFSVCCYLYINACKRTVGSHLSSDRNEKNANVCVFTVSSFPSVLAYLSERQEHNNAMGVQIRASINFVSACVMNTVCLCVPFCSAMCHAVQWVILPYPGLVVDIGGFSFQ